MRALFDLSQRGRSCAGRRAHAARIVLAAVAAAGLLAGAAPAARAGRLNVVASIPDLGTMAERIGGDHVRVIVLASGREDLHGVPVRPSFIPKLNRADLLLTLGLDAEHAWLPALARESRNRKIMEDQPGWIEVYRGIELLEIPTVISRSEGEQHPEGNPHFNIGPQCAAVMARNIAEALIGDDPEHAAEYEEQLADYERELAALVERLRAEGAPLRGVAIVSYHPDVAYIAEFYGMRVIGSLEPKAGIQPTARHLQELAERARAAGVRLVVHHQAQSGKLPADFAARIGAEPVMYANMVGAKKEIRTFAELQEYNLRVLLAALRRTTG